jgi:hypothetical protein
MWPVSLMSLASIGPPRARLEGVSEGALALSDKPESSELGNFGSNFITSPR